MFEGDALMTEAVGTSETSVNFYQTTRRNIPEDSRLQNSTRFNIFVEILQRVTPLIFASYLVHQHQVSALDVPVKLLHMTALNGQCDFPIDSVNKKLEDSGIHYTSSENSMDLIAQLKDEGAHHLGAPVGQYMRKPEAQNKPSEADCIRFTVSWYCMDLI
jgi:hypothetical protein